VKSLIALCLLASLALAGGIWSPGLVGSWSLENAATDGSGNGNDGTSYNTAYVTGKFGQCDTLNGSSAYVDLGSAMNFERTQAFSLCLWLKTGSTGYRALLTHANVGGASRGIHLFEDNNNKIEFTLINTHQTNWAQRKGVTSLNNNAWKFLVVTYDGSSTAAGMHVYLNAANDDGAATYDALSGSILCTANTYLGKRLDGYYWDGPLDEVQIWTRALTQAEIQRVYLGLTP
jgi:hypothetical protein